MYNEGMHWTEFIFDTEDEKAAQKLVRKNSNGISPVLILDFNHRQLGYSDEWLSRKITEAMADKVSIETDFLNKWHSGNETSPIDKVILDKIINSAIDPLYTEITDFGYIIRWYISEEEVKNLSTRDIVLGLDTSDAVGSDDIALVITDLKTGNTLGVGQFNETNTITFSEFIFKLLQKLTKATLVIERRSTGVTIIDNLLLLMEKNDMDPFKRMFNWVVDEFMVNTKRYSEIDMEVYRRPSDVYISNRKHFGYATSGSGKSSRDNLYGVSLLQALKYTGSHTYDKALISQIAGLTIKNGRIDHRNGEHDDLVIAKMLSYWFLTNAKNLSFYGYDTRNVLANLSLVDSDISDDLEKKKKIKEQQLIKDKIDALIDQMLKEKDSIKIAMIANRVKYLNSFIDVSLVTGLNIDGRLRDIELERSKKYY